MKLPAGSIKKWVDLERLFLARFSDDDTKVSVPTLLATKQRKGKSIKTYVERFRSMGLRCPSGEQAEEIVARVKAEEATQPKPQQQRNENNAPCSKGKETLTADVNTRTPPTKQGKAPNQPRAPK
ncbi:uncharacterized protein A4U43_C04F22340 [Asparagus officinalis]|uniref:Retrotransposon gag domain-containing protein n=1 Tax=Asparagus officinalis TaxID=4686 RepID=A0A5P1F7T1_ASPOF|nr:uncharacterized protein A4U43_C04F22340 [Asparagus officinalis]